MVFASIGFFIVVVSGVGVYLAMKADANRRAGAVPAKMLLTLDLDESIEGATGRRLEGFGYATATPCRTLIAIRRAKDDARVEGWSRK